MSKIRFQFDPNFRTKALMATLDLISNKTHMHTTYALPTISEKNCLLFLKVLEDRVI